MISLGDQFEAKLKLQVAKFLPNGAKKIARGIERQMHDNVDDGRSFDPGKYERSYAERTKKDRKRGGYQTEYADLQRSQGRVKSTFVEMSGDTASIKFRRGGEIMHGHNWGQSASGKKKSTLPRRQLFPDIQGGGKGAKGTGDLSNPDAIPKKIVEDAHKLGTKIMNIPV